MAESTERVGNHTRDELLAENQQLRQMLCELEQQMEELLDTVRAIRGGEVDAFVVNETRPYQVVLLETANRPYRLLLDRMQQGAVTLTSDGTIADCTRSFAELVGQPPDRLVGTSFPDYLIPGTLDAFKELLQVAASGAAQTELSIARLDATVPVLVAASGLLEDDGTLCLVVTDLTEQKRYEELKRREQALRDADRRKDQFLAMLSHELRNPLSALVGAYRILMTEGMSERDQTWAKDVLGRQLSQLQGLIDDLLDLSRLMSGKIELRTMRTDLAGLVRRAVDGVRHLIDSHRHDLSVITPQAVLWVEGDAIRLEQVFSNLLTNACKYTPDGGRIELMVEATDDQAVVRVKDSGVGIPSDLLASIFEPFTQGRKSIDRSHGGLGIGLSVVRQLVELHGGSITATSEGEGKGAEFVVRLPRIREGSKSPAGPGNRRHAGGPGCRVLVVDDHADSARGLQLLLQTYGHEVRVIADGRAALETLREFQPSVVLLDLALPGLDGYQVLRQLRAEAGSARPLIIAVTGYGQAEDKLRALEAGFDEHLVKPLDHYSLLSLIARATASNGE